jgi:predicted signal transduction protein with EAL and GGDEF domain
MPRGRCGPCACFAAPAFTSHRRFRHGYSSLSRLSQLPVDTLKIDRSFTSRLPADQTGCTGVSTIIGLARAFNMTTVAEGVETREQLLFLEHAGCTESQGYLHSRPIPAAEFELLLSQHTDLRIEHSPNDEFAVLPHLLPDDDQQTG